MQAKPESRQMELFKEGAKKILANLERLVTCFFDRMCADS